MKYLVGAAALCLFLNAAAERTLPQVSLSYKGELTPTMQDYIPASMTLEDSDGTVSEFPYVMLKTRGATAKQYGEKPSLNLKLRDASGDELDTDLLGLREASSFILDAMAIDRINMRNRVGFDIWNSFSRLPYESDFGSRNGTVGKFVEMYINGAYKGIYCLTDKINRKLLDLKKPEVDEATGAVTVRGILYKNGTSDIDNQNVPGYFNDCLVYVAEWHDAWELHEPEDYASEAVWAPLADLYATGPSGKPNYEDYAYVKEHFWIENLADYAIHTIALGIADNWGAKNKYYSIQNVTKKGDKSRFVVTPWDLDTSLGGEWDGSLYGGHLKTDWTVEDAGKKQPEPLSVCFAQLEFRQLMKARWLEGRSGAFAPDSVAERLEDYAALFIESGAWERTVKAANPHDLIVTDLQSEIKAIEAWYADRFKEMDRFLGVTQEDIDSAELGSIVATETLPDAIYNLHGIPVTTVTFPGIYVINGRKTVIIPGR